MVAPGAILLGAALAGLIVAAAAGNSAESHHKQGLAMYRRGRHAEALASFDKAVGMDPKNADMLSNRGYALRALGRHEDALADFE